MSNVAPPPPIAPIPAPAPLPVPVVAPASLETHLAVGIPHAISWICLWSVAVLHALAMSSDPLLATHANAFTGLATMLSVVTSFNWTSWTTASLPHSLSGWSLGAASLLHALAMSSAPQLAPFHASFLGLGGILTALASFNWKDVSITKVIGYVETIAVAAPQAVAAVK